MKPLVLILAFSLVANAILVTFAVRSKSGPFSNFSSGANASTGTNAGAAKASTSTEGALSAVDTKTWSLLQTGDLKALADRLRAAGFPPAVIRAIISAQLTERYAAQRKALFANMPETPFWQRTGFGYDPKMLTAMRDLNRQQNKELKDLLGPDATSNDSFEKAWQRRQFGDLPPDKLEQMQSIISDYSDLRNEIYSKANGVMLPEDREKLALLEKEQRADLASALTPEELENYELRSSSTANAIRSQLSIFKPTEQEFRDLFKATRAAEDKYGSLSNIVGSNYGDQAQKIRDSVLTDIQSQMSPDRLAELKQATDPKYQMTNRLVARLDLPASASVDTVAIQQDIQQRAAALRRDTSLSSDQRNAQIAELAQDATTKLTATLTPRGFEAYKQYGGNWLQNLTPPVRRPSPTP
jgi:uncharacterized protein YceK